MAGATMSRAERSELGQLIRKRERVMKSAASERSAQILAEFDRQSAAIYAYDDDAVWKKAAEAAKAAVADAQIVIEMRCKELGIPPEFAPGLSVGWYGRGQNAAADRRSELRRLAKSRIEAIEKEAVTKIERLSLTAQTEVIASGLESDAARNFLESMPALEKLMPQIDVGEVKALIDAKHAKRDQERDFYER